MDQNLLRIIVLGGGILMGISLMGCATEGLLPTGSDSSSEQASPKHAPSFTQFSDIPVPPAATMDMDRSLLLGASEEWTGRLVYSSSNSTAQIFDLYKAEMPKFGWQEMTVIRGQRTVMTFQRGARVATIEVSPRTLQGTEVFVTVSPNAAAIMPSAK